MGNTIELVIPEGMWRKGNVLFTPTFILRLLKHQTTSYYFDLDYKINIMDQDVQNITLSSNRFIVLEENSYIISSV
jgi:mannose-1-phosphate guanylyltransferase